MNVGRESDEGGEKWSFDNKADFQSNLSSDLNSKLIISPNRRFTAVKRKIQIVKKEELGLITQKSIYDSVILYLKRRFPQSVHSTDNDTNDTIIKFCYEITQPDWVSFQLFINFQFFFIFFILILLLFI